MAPSLARRAKRPSPKEARAALARTLQLQEQDAQRALERELVELMTQINALLRKEKERAALPVLERRFRGEDPRSALYFRMLRRAGLPEVHARFAPWFLKAHKLRLGRRSAALFAQLEAAFSARAERLSTLEQRMRGHQRAYAAAYGANAAAPSAPPPRVASRALLRRAFRDCSFRLSPAADDEQDAAEREEEHEAGAAPPGLAPAVRGTPASRGKHAFFSYAGPWRRGEMTGAAGVYAFADGGRYVGAWRGGAAHGAGRAWFPNGVAYEGEFSAGRFHGRGVLSGPGFRYAGDFARGERCGHGTLELLAAGATYTGEFFRGRRHGRGTETSASGAAYSGEWRAGRLCGRGELLLPDGRTRVARADWPPLLLGEAVRLAQRERRAAAEREEREERALLRVRDDLRALDLQRAFEAADDARRERADAERLQRRKQARRDKREAQAAARQAFLERAQRSSGEDDGDGEEEEVDEEDEDEDDGEDEDEDEDEDEGEDEGDGEDEDDDGDEGERGG